MTLDQGIFFAVVVFFIMTVIVLANDDRGGK